MVESLILFRCLPNGLHPSRKPSFWKSLSCSNGSVADIIPNTGNLSSRDGRRDGQSV